MQDDPRSTKKKFFGDYYLELSDSVVAFDNLETDDVPPPDLSALSSALATLESCDVSDVLGGGITCGINSTFASARVYNSGIVQGSPLPNDIDETAIDALVSSQLEAAGLEALIGNTHGVYMAVWGRMKEIYEDYASYEVYGENLHSTETGSYETRDNSTLRAGIAALETAIDALIASIGWIDNLALRAAIAELKAQFARLKIWKYHGGKK